MKSIIQQVDGWENLTAAEILTNLSQEVDLPNQTPVTISAIQAVLGNSAARLVVGTLAQARNNDPLLEPAMMALSTTGMRLDTPDRQAMIDQLAVAGNWPNPVRDAVKELGVRKLSRWVVFGGQGDLPTEEEVATGKQEAFNELSSIQARTRGATAINAAINAALTGGDEAAQRTALIDAWDGSV